MSRSNPQITLATQTRSKATPLHPEQMQRCRYGSAYDQLAGYCHSAPEGSRYADYIDLRIESAFQPIYSLRHRRAVGVEGLIRAWDRGHNRIAPPNLFMMAQQQKEVVRLDRLCRLLHVENFARQRAEGQWLFLNVDPAVVINGKFYGSFFTELLHHSGIAPHQVVIEITENGISDESMLEQAIEYYRELGCLIAIDDFGAGHSNLERVIRLNPDIVKLDRSIAVEAEHRSVGRKILKNLVRMIHEAEALVVMEGVENDEQALLALEYGVDFVQGFHFAHPQADIPNSKEQQHFKQLIEQACSRQKEQRLAQQNRLSPYLTAVSQSAKSLAAGIDIHTASYQLSTLERVNRIYLINELGLETGEMIAGRFAETNLDMRYAPLTNSESVDWSRSHHFRMAITEPDSLHTSEIYLSPITARSCRTICRWFERNGKGYILACDLDCSEK